MTRDATDDLRKTLIVAKVNNGEDGVCSSRRINSFYISLPPRLLVDPHPVPPQRVPPNIMPPGGGGEQEARARNSDSGTTGSMVLVVEEGQDQQSESGG